MTYPGVKRTKPILLTVAVGLLVVLNTFVVGFELMHFYRFRHVKVFPWNLLLNVGVAIWATRIVYVEWRKYCTQFAIVPVDGKINIYPSVYQRCPQCRREACLPRGLNCDALFLECQWCGEEYRQTYDVERQSLSPEFERLP